MNMQGKTPFDQYQEASAVPLRMLAAFLGFIFSIIVFLLKISILLLIKLVKVIYSKVKTLLTKRQSDTKSIT